MFGLRSVPETCCIKRIICEGHYSLNNDLYNNVCNIFYSINISYIQKIYEI